MTALARRMFSVAGCLALAGAGAALWLRYDACQDWLEDMRATDCRPVLPLPEVTTEVWAAVVLAALAALCLGAVTATTWTGPRRTTGRAVGGLALPGVALVVLVTALFLAATTPTNAQDGLDGSGLPCPSSL